MAVVVKLCVHSPVGPMFLLSGPREFNSQPAGKFLKRNFWNRSIMSNASLLVAETIHQGHERFSDISRGRQCSFMIFLALL